MIRDHSAGISPGRCRALATASVMATPAAPATTPAAIARRPRCAVSAAPASAPIAPATPICWSLSLPTQRTYRLDRDNPARERVDRPACRSSSSTAHTGSRARPPRACTPSGRPRTAPPRVCTPSGRPRTAPPRVKLGPVRVISLGFRTDLALRALEGSQITDRGDYLVIRSPDNPDHWWGNFILLSRAPEPRTGGAWLARFAAEFPAASHVAIGVDTTEDQVAVPEAFLAAGLELQRAVVLTAPDVRPPSHPNGEAEIRVLASEADWRQSVDLSVRF